MQRIFLSAKDSNGIPEERLIIAKEVFLKNKVSISRQVKEKTERIACRYGESIGVEGQCPVVNQWTLPFK